METNYFEALSKVKCEVEKKNGLNYISWSDAWAEVKKIHPTATYTKIKNCDSYLFKSGTGGSVECEVTINGVSHISDLAITDMRNQEIKYESIKSTDIQNTLQRAFAKAIAMHGIGLYVYRGEDLPEDGNEASEVESKKAYTTPKGQIEFMEYIDMIQNEGDTNHISTLFNDAIKLYKSEKQIDWLKKEARARTDFLTK